MGKRFPFNFYNIPQSHPCNRPTALYTKLTPWKTRKTAAPAAKRGSRPINEYDTSGRYLRTWISASAFARHYGISTTPVFICLSGKGKTVAGRQVRYYSGSIENISSTKKTCFVIKKYDFEKPVPAEYLYVFKSKREQVMEAIEMPLKNIAMTRNTAKDNENKIKEYIISLEQEIEKLKKTLELYNYQVKTDEVN